MDTEININLELEKLLNYGLRKSFIHPDDICLVRNQLIDFLRLEGYENCSEPIEEITVVDDTIYNILQFCFETNLMTDGSAANRELMMAKIMSYIAPKQSEVIKKFRISYAQSPIDATDYLYNLCLDLNYVKRSNINKKIKWHHEEEYGYIECVVSFTTRSMLADKSETKKQYPRCSFCSEMVGFAGGAFPGKNLRIIKQMFAEDTWYFGYSPFAHFNEHCILANERHEPNEISIKTFKTMLEFINKYPHYFLGADADLPSIGECSHSHFVGGCEVLPVEYAERLVAFEHPEYERVAFYLLKWPVSAIRIEGDNIDAVADAANHIYNFWKNYSNDSIGIEAFTIENGEKIYHNSISTVARKNVRGSMEIDLFLRNNSTTQSLPNGVFNVPEKHKNIKNGSIKITDVMGLIVMPAEINNDILHMMSYLMSGAPYKSGGKFDLDKHAEWIEVLQEKYGAIKNFNDAKSIMQYEVGRKYAKILENCGIFKLDGGIEEFRLFALEAGLVVAEA